MSEEISCPFCGNSIQSDALKCEECGALFKEPSLPNIKFKELNQIIENKFIMFYEVVYLPCFSFILEEYVISLYVEIGEKSGKYYNRL